MRFRLGFSNEAIIYLGSWFCLNVVLTIWNKLLLEHDRFPYALILTAIHLGLTWLAIESMIAVGLVEAKDEITDFKKAKEVFLFSWIFSINIWLSNYSLSRISMSIHQLSRALSPLFTLIISAIMFSRPYSLSLLPSVLLIITGVAITTVTDVSANLFDMGLVLLSCFFASLKGVLSCQVQIGGDSKISSTGLLRFVCPITVVQLLLFSIVTGEYQGLKGFLSDNPDRTVILASVVSQGIFAAMLNFVSFKCSAHITQLTMNIAGNLKQAFTPVVYLYMSSSYPTPALLIGITCTTVGASFYAKTSSSVNKSVLPEKTLLDKASRTTDE